MPPIFQCEQRSDLFPALFDTAAASLAIALNDGTLLKFNRAFCDFLGYSEAELLRLKVLDITFSEDRGLTAARVQKASERKRTVCHHENRFVRKGGTIVWGLVSISRIEGHGPTACCMVIIQDITARKASEIALRESERRFRAVFENAAAGMNTLTPQGRFLQVNRALCQFLGYREEELLGMSEEEVTHPDDLDLTRRAIQKAQSGPPFSWHCEKRYRQKDGSILWAHVSGVWQLDETGLPEYAIGLIQDITEHKRSEEALQYLANYDPLTDLPKRPLLETVLQHALERARRERQRLALLVMDLDQFRAIHESFGHKIRDEVLVAVVQRLRGVDDEPRILSALRRVLFDNGYRVLTADSAREGFELLAQNAVQVIITDQRMPEMSGTEFLRRVKALHPNTVRLVLSGYADLPTVTESVNEGALYKFLAKPWDDDHLREQIRDAFYFYEANIKPRTAPR